MKIKENPEDFIVEEVINLEKNPGEYLYIELKKKNWNTLTLINKLVRVLNIPRKFIGFAGSKDKKAITTQYISIFRAKKQDIEKIKIKESLKILYNSIL